jgi:EAL domain-containing protein (putative c-di-GMP-specific phosphodiesterase class I)/CheY-like chemotaxis protein
MTSEGLVMFLEVDAGAPPAVPGTAGQSFKAPAAEPKGRLLVVDDEPALLRAYTRALTRDGYEVRGAADGVRAKELLAGGNFDVIISDVCMPGMDGLELLRTVRRIDVDVPVILVTGAPTSLGAGEAVESGALLYLVKPVEFRALLQVVEHAIRLHRIARLKRDAMAHLGATEGMVGDRTGLEVRFESALASIWIAYQPIVRWKTREIYGYEALLRSGEPLLATPGAVLDAAERLGRLPELGRAIRARVAATIGEAPGNAAIFVNLHPHDLADDTLFAPGSPLSRIASRVVLEITERASLDEFKDITTRIADLRALGFRIAIDDLGAGYAGLTSFAQLQPEVVKLDMSLVRDVHKEPVKRKLITAMTSLCSEMGMLVVAEGIECVEERDTLAAAGCHLMQGYLFAKPGKGFPGVKW